MKDILFILLLTILQNASFTLVSRARNGDSLIFHALAAIVSNTIWLLVISKVVHSFDRPILMVTYIIGSTVGSLIMHYLSMKYFEKWFKKPKNK